MRRFANALMLTAMLACFPAIARLEPLLDPVQQVVEAGLMTRTNDGNFRANASLSRAELASVLVKTFDLNRRLSAHAPSVAVRDVSRSHWAYSDIQTVLRIGIMTAYPGDRFLPNHRVTRAEAFAAIAQAYGSHPPSDAEIQRILKQYADANSIPSWARKPMATALSEGLVDLEKSNRIHPQKPLTRKDMAHALSIYLSQRRGQSHML